MEQQVCPVCGYDELEEPPQDFSICPACGTEFGYDDFSMTREELRRRWLERGAPWFSTHTPTPPRWDPVRQLAQLLTPREEPDRRES